MTGAWEWIRSPLTLRFVGQEEELVASEFAIVKDLGEESGTDRLACVNGHHGSASIAMTQEVVTSSDAYVIEAGAFERFDELLARQTWKTSHVLIVTRWIPTKSSDSTSSPCSSTQSAMASRILSIT